MPFSFDLTHILLSYGYLPCILSCLFLTYSYTCYPMDSLLPLIYHSFFFFFCFYFLKFYMFLFLFGPGLRCCAGFSLIVVSMGFLFRWPLSLQSKGSGVRELGSCGPMGLVARQMWNLPGLGIKLVSPALAGRFLSTVPSGKSSIFKFYFGV